MAETKTHPILFKGEMVRAILDKRKSQTRRVITPRNSFLDGRSWDKRFKAAIPDWESAWVDPGPSPAGNPGPYLKLPFPEFGTTHRIYPRWAVDDRLWVRENWQAQTIEGKWWHDIKKEDRSNHNWAVTNPVKPAFDVAPPRWLPSIHMPRWASRITLEITNVRVEKVQDISGNGIILEGVADRLKPHTAVHYAVIRKRFSMLWDSINAKRGHSWESNPWIWIVEFKILGA